MEPDAFDPSGRRADPAQGYAAAELVGMPAAHPVPEDGMPAVPAIGQRVEQGETVTSETEGYPIPGTAGHTMPPIRLLIADDHTLVRQGLRQLCEGLGGFTVAAEAANGAQAVALARTTQPDVILMDIVMPDIDGVEAIRQIMREDPAARIIALTMYRQEQYMLDAIRAGARGYLLKSVDSGELIAAIEAVHRGEYLIDPIIAARVLSELHLAKPQVSRVEPLTESEMAVLRLVACGVENEQIAQTLNYSIYTVANRLRTIYGKLHVTNRTQAALYALRHGWAALDEPPG